ncbi:olfactory receptor 8S1-like [Choloepus didactylus]|uniref:olfactory receptor 8S1-like n=1 Tax=Choloepus didactylus TaxID=27675 RepID=UPI00189DE3AF|nr:olfactory receptor 8S1-like [Choloepus didactylus]
MAYDRYVAICHPLIYGQKMNNQLCKELVLVSWGLGILSALLNTIPAMKLDFCGDESIPHYSCKLPSLFPLSCSEVSTNLTVLLCSGILHGIRNCFLIFYSYIPIVSTILSISFSSDRSKAFSTCSSHLIVVLLHFDSAFLCYLLPVSVSPLELIFSVQYSVITPLVNPLIDSLKNNEVKAAVRRALRKYFHYIR